MLSGGMRHVVCGFIFEYHRYILSIWTAHTVYKHIFAWYLPAEYALCFFTPTRKYPVHYAEPIAQKSQEADAEPPRDSMRRPEGRLY